MIYKIRTYADLTATLKEMDARALTSEIKFVTGELDAEPQIHSIVAIKTVGTSDDKIKGIESGSAFLSSTTKLRETR